MIFPLTPTHNNHLKEAPTASLLVSSNAQGTSLALPALSAGKKLLVLCLELINSATPSLLYPNGTTSVPFIQAVASTPFDTDSRTRNASIWYLETTESGSNYSITFSVTNRATKNVYEVFNTESPTPIFTTASTSLTALNDLVTTSNVPQNCLAFLAATTTASSTSVATDVSLTASSGPTLTLDKQFIQTSTVTYAWAVTSVQRSPVRGETTYTFSYSPSTSTKVIAIAAWR